MPRPVNQAQRAVLDWLATGARDTPPIAAYKQVSVALQTRGLVTISRAGGIWSATLTSAGRYFQKHGRYRTSPSSTSQGERGPEFEVDSPRGIRAQGYRPRGDPLRLPVEPDPWDSRILITVKEAAWLLSVNEAEIRRAATSGEVQRVFIGTGETRYRVVYGSLLAWVNDMPRDSARRSWWSRW